MGRMPRSYLYVPGIDTRRMAKVLDTGTDAVIVDLEDAVPADRKDEARDIVRAWTEGLGAVVPDVWIRANSGERGLQDVASLRDCAGIAGFVLAKADLGQVQRATEVLEGSGLAVVPLLETAGAILAATQIAAAGVQHLQIGEYDLCADVGLAPGPDETETAWARAQVVFASSAAGLMPPVAPVSVEIRDTELFAASTRLAARQGFVGRTCIHPAQVTVVNEVFTPTSGEVEAAREILGRFAALDGSAVMVDDAGRLVDEATLRSARRTLALAGEETKEHVA
ncbi:HpcH/HpaI aldolase/citrate lyase family protein [Aeromicrobium duanguangcaii]|uniref:CoA ester lyase n=1 Tax=Aeromicrobium duanguangcaii TaxID=2968086 RepID=A0ABY5KCT4_9ACTN|nr:CoA ester lyase [Aeromicrobium duanguangcaii]MCD9155079.1 CoA ester lyase [Aeromicrobium duanguangcaii]UUI68266.1 CoA ester lyase [Aeromicrobium duanguangcaii]